MTSQQQNSAGIVDPLDLLDFSEYDGLPYQSPSVSPPTTGKAQFARPSQMSVTPPTLPSNQVMSGPSHQYDQYKQQTPFVPGALASTIAVNQNNADITGYNLEYMSPADELFDFNSAPSQSSGNADMDVDFESPEASFFFPEPTINPNAIGGPDQQQLQSATVPSQTRMYPGMHQQAALAKAQAQQRQQQQLIQQQQQQRQSPQGKQQRSKAQMPSDPIVEQKITQLLNSMRSKSGSAGPEDDAALMHIARTKKEEEDMDEDERLLASEEGKKLSSKERRQLRNKVSARAFRSRRKEYIGQLESEIANKVSENGDLRAQNRALMDENRRLSDLSRMLLSSPAFSNFLDNLSSNPAPVPQLQQQQQQVPKMEQQQAETQQLPKDINPYAIAQQTQPHQIGMAMIPEQTMDFSMLSMESDTFSYQPRVFSVLETPEVPQIDVAALSGKTSRFHSDVPSICEEKMSAPIIEAPVCPTLEKPQAPKARVAAVSVAAAPANLDGDIYDDEEASNSTESVFNGVKTEKAFARYELVNASDKEASSSMALRRVEQLSASLEATLARLEQMTIGL